MLNNGDQKEKKSTVLLRAALPTGDQTRQGKKRKKKKQKEREKYNRINDLLWILMSVMNYYKGLGKN